VSSINTSSVASGAAVLRIEYSAGEKVDPRLMAVAARLIQVTTSIEWHGFCIDRGITVEAKSNVDGISVDVFVPQSWPVGFLLPPGAVFGMEAGLQVFDPDTPVLLLLLSHHLIRSSARFSLLLLNSLLYNELLVISLCMLPPLPSHPPPTSQLMKRR
jgi:hypothetical protein